MKAAVAAMACTGITAILAAAAWVVKRRDRAEAARLAALTAAKRAEWERIRAEAARSREAQEARLRDPVAMTPGEEKAWADIAGRTEPGIPPDIAARIQKQIGRGDAA